MDVDIDDHSDHSIHFDDHSFFVIEGDRYSNVYVYTDQDGKTYRGRDLDCIDFDSQADAQRVLDANGSDPNWLDGDGDGVACEVEQGEFTSDVANHVGVRRGGQVSVYPVGAIDTGVL